MPTFALAGFLCSGAVLAQATPPADAPIHAAEQSAVVATLGQQLKSRYIFPDVAASTAAALSAKAARGGYRDANTATAFADALTADLRSMGKDRHFRVGFAPGMPVPPQRSDAEAYVKEIARMRPALASEGYGISRVQVLPGSIGYIDLRIIGPAEIVGAAYGAAISLVSGTRALILDLRSNRGGEPGGVANLVSHFFAAGDVRHINDIHYRADNSTRQYWTTPAAMPRFAGPIYVLTSSHTFSAAEECAYDLQTQKRATLVGEATGGAANPGEAVSLGHGFLAFISTGRPINPVTGTNWEHVGVKPDVAVSADSAMKVAYTAILDGLVKKSTDPDERADLKGVLARVRSGELALPAYSPHH
jgi:C-terminal processing protease CtpA/Prc